MKVVVIEPKKSPEIREIKGDLSSLQKCVGGMIQPIRWTPSKTKVRGKFQVYVNEEGFPLGLSENRALPVYGTILGPILFMKSKGLSQEDCDIIVKEFA